MAKTSIGNVKERFGSKAKLVGELAVTLERAEGENDADFKARLSRATNRQLLRLHAVETRVREEFGTKEKLVDAVYAQRRHGKVDADYKKSLAALRKTVLLDMYLVAQKGAKTAPRAGASAKAKS